MAPQEMTTIAVKGDLHMGYPPLIPAFTAAPPGRMECTGATDIRLFL